MSSRASPETRLPALLQEQSQYREEVRMFDAHLFRVILTYVTALVAAFGWLGTQIIEQAKLFLPNTASVLEPDALAQATTVVLTGLSKGPFFYFFAALPVISFLMFLYVARDWVSLHERFALLARVSNDVGALLGENSHHDPGVFRFDRGLKVGQSRLRSFIEILLVVIWAAGVLFASITILLRLEKFADGPARRLWWWFGALGMAMILVMALVALGVFLKRSYGRLRRRRRIS